MKKQNKKNWVLENKKALAFGLAGLVIGAGAMIIMWPSRIAKLKNGEEPVISVDDLTLTADDLYKDMKSSYGITVALEKIDKALLNKEYDLDDEATEYAESTAENYYSQYEQYYGYTKAQFLEANNFESEDDFIEYLKFDYLRNTWYKAYLKNMISDKDIEKFYKNEAFGTKTVMFYSSTSDENDLEKLKSSLKKGMSTSDIEEKYSDITANELTISLTDIDTYSSTIISAIKNLKKGEYTKVIDDDTYGHLVVYVTSSEDLGKLEDEKDDIITALSTRLDSNDSTLYNKSFDELRKKYNLKISDTEIQKAYKEYISE